MAIKLPSHAPFDLSPRDPPKPSVRIYLHIPGNGPTEPAVGPLKLIAHLTPQSSVPLTTRNLLTTLSRFPFALFRTLPRIMYQAWLLHYRKWLPIFARPEPIPAPREWDIQEPSERSYSGGIIYQRPTLLQRYARRRTLAFLAQRCAETGVDIVLLSGDPSTQTWKCHAQRGANEPPTLRMTYTSPRVFTLFLLAPSAHLFFRTGCKSKTDGQCPLLYVSDQDAYMRIFEPGQNGQRLGWIEQTTQRMRSVSIPRDVFSDCTPLCHPLAVLPSSLAIRLMDLLVVSILVMQDWILARVFWMLRVRFVVETEPWMGDVWRRAAEH